MNFCESITYYLWSSTWSPNRSAIQYVQYFGCNQHASSFSLIATYWICKMSQRTTKQPELKINSTVLKQCLTWSPWSRSLRKTVVSARILSSCYSSVASDINLPHYLMLLLLSSKRGCCKLTCNLITLLSFPVSLETVFYLPLCDLVCAQCGKFTQRSAL